MVFMPPGSAKSTYSSVLFPPWFLAQKPKSAILTCSHSADLAVSFGRRSRNLIADHEKALDYSLSKDSQAADEWTTTTGGEFFCAGVGGRIAGRRADLGLIDDPIGSKEDAYSKTVRESTWSWYNFDFLTRLKPGAAIVIVQTRWHEDDLSGMLLKNEPGEWTVVNLPMIAEDNDQLGRAKGERLWDNYFTDKMVIEAQKNPTKWSALYQQHPTPVEGAFFKRSWIEDNLYDSKDLPPKEELTFYVASDHAVSVRQEADYTVLLPFASDQNDDIWVLPDVVWEQIGSMDAVAAMIRLMKKYKPRTWYAEKGHISMSIGPFLRKRQREEHIYTYVEEVHPAKDKQTRAQSIRARMEMGKVHFPRWVSWLPNALHQFLTFPAGTNDDVVDAIAHAGNALDELLKGPTVKPEPDLAKLLQPTVITLSWMKKSDKRQAQNRLFALQDN